MLSPHNRGFTLIEVLLATAIIGFLSAMSVFSIGNKLKQARDADRRTDIYEIRLGLEQYFIDNNRYPDALLFDRQPLTNDSGDITYLPRVHSDPLNRNPYLYTYDATPPGAADSYLLCANQLEAEENAFCLNNLQR